MHNSNDNVNPAYYDKYAVSPIDLIDSYNLNFALGSAIKYVARSKEKNGVEDLIKAIWYILHDIGFTSEQCKEYTKKIQEDLKRIEESEGVMPAYE